MQSTWSPDSLFTSTWVVLLRRLQMSPFLDQGKTMDDLNRCPHYTSFPVTSCKGAPPGLPLTEYPSLGNSSKTLKVFGPRVLAFTQRVSLCWNVLARQVLKNGHGRMKILSHKGQTPTALSLFLSATDIARSQLQWNVYNQRWSTHEKSWFLG